MEQKRKTYVQCQGFGNKIKLEYNHTPSQVINIATKTSFFLMDLLSKHVCEKRKIKQIHLIRYVCIWLMFTVNSKQLDKSAKREKFYPERYIFLSSSDNNFDEISFR